MFKNPQREGKKYTSCLCKKKEYQLRRFAEKKIIPVTCKINKSIASGKKMKKNAPNVRILTFGGAYCNNRALYYSVHSGPRYLNKFVFYLVKYK